MYIIYIYNIVNRKLLRPALKYLHGYIQLLKLFYWQTSFDPKCDTLTH